MGEPSRDALTSTPSIAPSSAEVTRPASAGLGAVDADLGTAGACATLAAAITAATRAIGMANRTARIGIPTAISSRLRLHHQAIDLDRGSAFGRVGLAPQGPLQFEAFLAAGDLDVLGIDVLAEAG